MSLSVIIPTYQRRASVERALRALAAQTLPAAMVEVIVSMDGSQDGTREMLAQFSAPYALRVLWQPNAGRAAACNAGIRAATGELIVLLDDDMEAAPELLEAHRQAHATRSRLGVMGAVPMRYAASAPPVVAYVGAKFNQHLVRLAQPNHRLQLRDFYSGNFSIRREVLLSVGLFDEAFKIYGNEDLELSLRLQQAGVQLRYCAEALAYQHYEKGFAGLARDHIAKGRTAVLMTQKHPETFADLKLSTYRQASLPWRGLRASLLRLGRVWPGTTAFVIASIGWLERWRPAHLHLFYTLALDYCYWLGAQSALGEQD